MQNCNFGKFKNLINNIYKPIREGHVTIILMLLNATNQKRQIIYSLLSCHL